MTPLHRTVQSRSADRHVIEFLLDSDINPTLRDKDGRTALTIAEDNKDAHIAYLLKKKLEKLGHKPDDFVKADLEGIVIGAGDDVDIEVGETGKATVKKKEQEKKMRETLNDMRGKTLLLMPP